MDDAHQRNEGPEKPWVGMEMTPEEKAVDQAAKMVFGTIDKKSPCRWWQLLKFWK